MASAANLHIILLNAYRELDDEEGRALIVAKRDEYEAIPRKIIEDCVAEGVIAAESDCALVTITLLGMLNWTYHWYDPDGRVSPDGLGDYFCRVIIQAHAPGSVVTPGI